MKRSGMTLLELLVAISIIGVLLGLFIPAAMKVKQRADDVRVTSEIAQMNAAVKQSYYRVYGFYPPSRLVICEKYTDYNLANPLDRDSLSCLCRMFPRLVSNNAWTVQSQGKTFIDWNGDGVPTGRVLLEGDQCLVFFLSGIKLRGWGQNPVDPSDFSGGATSPFYNFQTNRLVQRNSNNSTGGANGYWSYMDPYGTPYAYLSGYSLPNGYNRYFPLGDCDGLGVWPYATQPGIYVNSDSFQIICAGRDKVFAPGCPPNGTATWPNSFAGQNIDDRSNFASGYLSAN